MLSQEKTNIAFLQKYILILLLVQFSNPLLKLLDVTNHKNHEQIL